MPRSGNTDELPQMDQLQKTLDELGIGTRGRIVIYGDEPAFASRLFWTLDFLGQGKRIAILDGGLAQWKRDRHSVVTGPPNHKPRPFTARLELEHLTLLTQLQKGGAVSIVDARPASEFATAHIPNAINVPWQSTLTDAGLLRSADELRKLYPFAPPARVIPYCNTGLVSSWSYFVLRYLGYDPSLYDGGFEEWSRSALPLPAAAGRGSG